MNFIEFDNVSMVYGADAAKVVALDNVNLSVGKGELIALVGPSGCGKSTLMRIVSGLHNPTRGSVSIDGRKIVAPISHIGMVFQAPTLLRWRTVLENVLLPAELAGKSVSSLRGRALDLLKLVGVSEFAGKLPGQLSGGMQQRVALCRALLLNPPVLLMDEPFGALDAMTRDEMNLELLRVWGEGSSLDLSERKTVIFVTHSIPEAVFLADRVVVMSPRPGRITDVFNIDLPRPRTVRTRATPEFGRLCLDIYELLSGAEAGHSAEGLL